MTPKQLAENMARHAEPLPGLTVEIDQMDDGGMMVVFESAARKREVSVVISADTVRRYFVAESQDGYKLTGVIVHPDGLVSLLVWADGGPCPSFNGLTVASRYHGT